MKFSDVIEGFLICKTGNRKGDLSPKTIRLYRHVLGKVAADLNDPPIENITSKDLLAFMERQASPKRNLSTSAQDNYFKAIRSLWKWAESELKVPNAAAPLRQPLIVAEPVVPFSKQEVKRIMTATEFVNRTSPATRKPYQASRPTEIRDKAIITLLLDTGIRIGECSRLTLADIFWDTSTLKITPYFSGKKSRPRELPFGRNAKRWLWQYASAVSLNEKLPLFGLTITGLTRLFARLGERSGVAGVHAHRFRHTFAIEYLRNHGDVFTLQYILGHSDLTMCRRYLAIAKADIQNVHLVASPVDNWF